MLDSNASKQIGLLSSGDIVWQFLSALNMQAILKKRDVTLAI